MKIQTVCILGGSGFVGSVLAGKLTAKGVKVRIISRHPQRYRHLLVLPNIEVVEADILDFNRLSYYLHDIDAVINLVGILNDKSVDGALFRKMHVELPKLIVQACQKHDIRRLLQMSALHADAGSAPSHYLRTKGEGENYLHMYSEKGLEITTFRPSIIFGPGDNFYSRFARLIKRTPFIVPVPRATARFAPVYVGDVADVMVEHLFNKSSNGLRIDLCGPHTYSMMDIMQYTASQIGVKKRFIALPDRLSRFMAHLSDFVNCVPVITPIMNWLVPGFRDARFSIDNYRSLLVDSVCDENTDKQPTAVEDIVPRYLGDANNQKQYDNFRHRAHHE